MKDHPFEDTDEEDFYEQFDDFEEVNTDDSSNEEENLKDLVKSLSLAKDISNFFTYFEIAYNKAGALLSEGIVNSVYAISVLISLIWFRVYLETFGDWFDYSFCALFLSIALIFEVTYRLLKNKGENAFFVHFRAILNLIAAVLIFLFPNFFLGFIFGTIAFVLFSYGLMSLMRRTNFTLKRVLGVILMIISAFLFFLPSYSRLYYQYYLTSLILLRGIIQIVIAIYLEIIERRGRELEEGFTDYTIE